VGCMCGFLKLFFHASQSRVGVGGVKVGNQETARAGGHRFTQAQLRTSMAPTGSVFVFGWSVLPVRYEKIGFLRELGEGV
jgi:hypothetical protein